MIPFGGVETVTRSGREEHRWAAPHHAFFIPAGWKNEAESSGGAFLRLDLVETAVTRKVAGMANARKATHDALDLSRSRIVPLQVRGMNWLPVIRSLCNTIDAFDCDATRLVAAGFDDLMLRTVVMMLHPELFFEPRLAARQPRGFDLYQLLQQIEAHLAGRVTLVDMEAWSGLTRMATLISAYTARFGERPSDTLRGRSG